MKNEVKKDAEVSDRVLLFIAKIQKRCVKSNLTLKTVWIVL